MRQKILIADDESFIRECLQILFEDDYAVVQVENGQKAVEMLGREHFDLVLLDIEMPGMSGLEVLGWIRKNKLGSRVIVLSGCGQEALQKAKSLGADAALQKPIDVNLLKLAISRCLDV